jgi:hypothetical protein
VAGLACVAWLAGATAVETYRTRDPLPPGTPAPVAIDGAALHADVAALAAPEMQGRRTATDGGRRARAWVKTRFESLGLAPLPGGGLERPFSFRHRSIRALWRRDRPFEVTFDDAANVVGRLAGSDPAAGTLIVSAHYDHIGVRDGVTYPGADDDASGIAGLFAVAEEVRRRPLRHDLVLAAFDAEELGLRGARAFLDDPGFPRGTLRAVVDMDMIGRSDGGGVVVTGTWRNPQLRPLVEEAARRSPIRVFLRHDRPFWLAGFVDDWTTASDHGPFAEAGYAWLFVGVEDHADYHGPGDVAGKIDPAFHAAAASLVLDLLRQLDAR